MKNNFFAIGKLFILIILASLAACNGQNNNTKQTIVASNEKIIGDTVLQLGKNIDYIFQDKNNNYWFASNGDGLFYYNGKTIFHITDKHGLCSNFVHTIQEDKNGHLWFSTRDGICKYDGKKFIDGKSLMNYAKFDNPHYQTGGIFLGFDTMYYYDGLNFTKFIIYPPDYFPPKYNTMRSYGVYCTMVDAQGNIWFGTQEKGVGKYDGKTYTYLTDKHLAGPAVRAMYQDKSGILWFGNNGGGLYRYDGKELRNITEENNLGNEEFLKGKPIDKFGSMARIFALNSDNEGNLWIGTVDSGIWKYDGTTLTNYSHKDGLSANNVYGIFKNNKGELLFVANGENIYRFDGKSFIKFTLN